MTTATGATENLIELKVTQCAASTLSNDFNKIHIHDMLFPDGITHLWVDLEYSPALLTAKYDYFEVKDYGFVFPN